MCGERDSATWQRRRARGTSVLEGQEQPCPESCGKIVGKTVVEKVWKQGEGSSESWVTDWQGRQLGLEPSAEFSLHTHAHRIYAWRERRNRTMMAKQERRQSWSRRDTGERGEVRVAAGEEGWRAGAPWLANTQNLKQGHCLKLRERRREREREGGRKE